MWVGGLWVGLLAGCAESVQSKLDSGVADTEEVAPICDLLEATVAFEVIENVAYGERAEQRMDLFLPQGEGPFPAMILVHGGGWHSGFRESLHPMAERYASAGIATISIDYFLVSEERPGWPKNVQDVACAVRQVKARAGQLNLSVDRMAIGGTSAGGHLAALAGLMGAQNAVMDRACGDADTDHRVAVVVDYFGATDLTLMAQPGEGQRPQAAQMLGASWEEDPDLWNLASPIHHVSEDDPVVVIAHGTEDVAIPIEHSEVFYARLQELGVESLFVQVEGAGHSFHGQEYYNDQARCGVDSVLRQHLLEAVSD